jgi:hypothetical protein
MKEKYPATRMLSKIFKVVLMLGFIIDVVIAIKMMYAPFTRLPGIMLIVAGVVAVLVLSVIPEIANAIIGIEENTRALLDKNKDNDSQ